MKTARWMRLVVGLLALTLVLAACSGDDDGEGDTGGDTGGPTETGPAPSGDAITIEGFAFDPSTITVSGPTEITVTNNDSAAHTFTLDDGSVDEEIGSGESVTVTVDVSASTGFVCNFHPQMTGTVEVA